MQRRKKRRQKNKKGVWLAITVIIILIIIGIIIGHSRSKAKNEGILKEYLPTDLNTLDISKMDDVNSANVSANVQQGLLSRNKNEAPKPGLAKSWQASKDGKTWTFHLRKGLKWSNGDPLTASDFVYSWRRANDPKTTSQTAYVFNGIKNANAIYKGKNKDISSLGVYAPDKTTLVLKMEHPIAHLKDILSFETTFPQDKKFIQKQGNKYGGSSTRQVYSGPYKLVGWNGSNKKFKLRPNKHYWNQKAIKNKGVNLQVISDPTALISSYKKGNVDQAQLSTPQQVRQYKNSKQLHSYKLSSSLFFLYNQPKVPALKNPKIREALNLATNRKGIAKNNTAGLYSPATGITPSGMSKTPAGEDFSKAVAKNTNYQYNPKKAKTLFAQGMAEMGKKHLTLTIEADNDGTDSATFKPMLDSIQQSWGKLPGLSIKEKFVPKKQRISDINNDNYQVMTYTWGADYAEPIGILNVFYTLKNWHNNRFSADYKKASNTYALDPKKHTAAEVDAEKVLFNQKAVDPLLWKNSKQLIKPRISGLQHFSSGAEYYFWTAKVK